MHYTDFITEVVTSHYASRSKERQLPEEIGVELQTKIEKFLIDYFIKKFDTTSVTYYPIKKLIDPGIVFALRFNFNFSKEYLSICSFRYDRKKKNPYELIISWITCMDLRPNHKNNLIDKQYLISVSPNSANYTINPKLLKQLDKNRVDGVVDKDNNLCYTICDIKNQGVFFTKDIDFVRVAKRW